MKVYALSNLRTPIYIAEGLSYLPPILSADYAARRGTSRESLKEIIVADLGDKTSSSPYLIVGLLDDYVCFRALMCFRSEIARMT